MEVPKPNVSDQFFNDVQRFNDVIKLHSNLMPPMDKLLALPGCAAFITTLDFTKECWQTPLHSMPHPLSCDKNVTRRPCTPPVLQRRGLITTIILLLTTTQILHHSSTGSLLRINKSHLSPKLANSICAVMRGAVFLLFSLWAGVDAINPQILADVVQNMRRFGLENHQYAMAVRLTQQQCNDETAVFDVGVQPSEVQKKLKDDFVYLGERIIAAIPDTLHAEYHLLAHNNVYPSREIAVCTQWTLDEEEEDDRVGD
ncbi:hypothetical protein DPEC_G00311700 [Dallia pectoralis]|uniref:Uncharacterized protein n=1 Tax=Dallia pectoralis TaxID=75939 RepID=A0ACC2FBD7_DALPE|nr:hypothetical protein DPEC_G00311700 [Dallia pectoralis]